MMNEKKIIDLVEKQRNYYASGKTLSLENRENALLTLQLELREQQDDILKALKADLNKVDFEGYMTEVGIVLDELKYQLKHFKKWASRKKIKTPLSQFPAKSFVVPEPLGNVLIMAPWNYPFQLCLEPLVGAIAAGNTAIIKPSAYAANTSKAIVKLIEKCFDEEFVAVVEGGREENTTLLDQKFNYIFFTGSTSVGKLVMEKASKNLTPVSLELGGKSPCIVGKTADLKLAARRVAFGKYLNAGQTCVAPDYLMINRTVKDEFLELLKKEIESFFPNQDYSDMPVIINDKHYNRLKGLMKDGKIVVGGKFDDKRRFIEPTVIDEVDFSMPIMKEEIFGPILPVISYDNFDEALIKIKSFPKPLAFYLFTRDNDSENKVLNNMSFGGGCINDTIVHLATSNMGFGGVGDSGMGSYHGKESFNTFTHYKSILKKSNKLDLNMRYHPYTDKKFKVIKRFMK